MNPNLHFDYTTVGHVTIDVLEDGSRRAGGAAFYSALQASRLGRRTLILTRGVAHEIEAVIEPYRDELQLRILPAQQTTTLRTLGSGSARTQRVLAWAGPISDDLALDTSILHLAPVARESPSHWHGPVGFLGLTPQGLVRRWSAPGAEIELTPPTPAAAMVAGRCNAIAVSEHEHAACAGMIDAASAAGAIVAVTAGARPTTLLVPGGASVELHVPEIADPVDDLGAGDVFAAAFFIELAAGRPPLQAAAFANAAAAVRVAGVDRVGAGAIGERTQIEARLAASTAAAPRGMRGP
jgi:1D-myo-inositol 3-kinase